MCIRDSHASSSLLGYAPRSLRVARKHEIASSRARGERVTCYVCSMVVRTHRHGDVHILAS
eukprot:376835-Alexandrium_andersonii.AAC.1